MIRIQIQVTEGQHRGLHAAARVLGVSVSELVRRRIEDWLALEPSSPTRAERVAAALAVAGKYREPGEATRVAEEHDRHLAESYRA
jgi:hypothetical protein